MSAVNEELLKLVLEGQTIEAMRVVDVDNGRLEIDILAGPTVFIRDDYQQCCEQRYMTCDDPLEDIRTETVQKVELRTGGQVQDDAFGEHEAEFLLITTNRAEYTIVTHNVHNGYYGGFDLRVGVQERISWN